MLDERTSSDILISTLFARADITLTAIGMLHPNARQLIRTGSNQTANAVRYFATPKKRLGKYSAISGTRMTINTPTIVTST